MWPVLKLTCQSVLVVLFYVAVVKTNLPISIGSVVLCGRCEK